MPINDGDHLSASKTVKLVEQLGVGSPTASNADFRITTVCSRSMLSVRNHRVQTAKRRQLLHKEKPNGAKDRPCLRLPEIPAGPLGARMFSLA